MVIRHRVVDSIWWLSSLPCATSTSSTTMKTFSVDSVWAPPKSTGALNVTNTSKLPCTGAVASLVRVMVKGGATV